MGVGAFSFYCFLHYLPDRRLDDPLVRAETRGSVQAACRASQPAGSLALDLRCRFPGRAHLFSAIYILGDRSPRAVSAHPAGGLLGDLAELDAYAGDEHIHRMARTPDRSHPDVRRIY